MCLPATITQLSSMSASGLLSEIDAWPLISAFDPKRTLRSGGNGVIAHHIRFQFEFIKSVL